ncbi:MAG: hypothetical protein IT306_17205 [Chloroflexi bacterium]|nr:hypothetical protein [Chloroflexota bacterium]
MPTPGTRRTLGLALVLCTLLLTACGSLLPAAPTPTPAAKPAGAGSAGGGGGGGGGRAAQANGGGGAGQGQGQRGQGQGQGGGGFRNGGQGSGQGQGAGPGQAASQARATGSPDALSPNVNGEVDIVDGRLITVATNTGWRKVLVPESATIQSEGKGTNTDLVAGARVGVTGKPDGTAVSIRIFGQNTNPRLGQFPMQGAQAGNVMTNASIVSFNGSTLVVDIGGQQSTIAVTPETEVVKPVPAALTDIAIGTRVQANGTVSGDTVTAQTVTILTAQRGGRG